MSSRGWGLRMGAEQGRGGWGTPGVGWVRGWGWGGAGGGACGGFQKPWGLRVGAPSPGRGGPQQVGQGGAGAEGGPA